MGEGGLVGDQDGGGLLKKEGGGRCACACESLGQWVISASGGFSKARGGQPGRGLSVGPAMQRAVRRGPHLISTTLIPTGVPGAPGQPKQ